MILANVQLDPTWTEGDFIEFLNEHVFFWPGVKLGPIRYGARLLDHYEEQSPAVIRVCTATLLAENRLLTPLFCAFNSGAPRSKAVGAFVEAAICSGQLRRFRDLRVTP